MRLDLARTFVLLGALALGCSRGSVASSGTASASSTTAGGVSLGNVMVEIARRFEIAGRAANANRFELAAFEAGELHELFETDVPRARLPKEGPTGHIPAMASAFRETNAPELEKAAAAGDHVAFGVAFQHAAAACNACHGASAKAFIQVPSEPGKAVPDLDLQPSPSAVRH
jgi:hypothetical protein